MYTLTAPHSLLSFIIMWLGQLCDVVLRSGNPRSYASSPMSSSSASSLAESSPAAYYPENVRYVINTGSYQPGRGPHPGFGAGLGGPARHGGVDRVDKRSVAAGGVAVPVVPVRGDQQAHGGDAAHHHGGHDARAQPAAAAGVAVVVTAVAVVAWLPLVGQLGRARRRRERQLRPCRLQLRPRRVRRWVWMGGWSKRRTTTTTTTTSDSHHKPIFLFEKRRIIIVTRMTRNLLL